MKETKNPLQLSDKVCVLFFTDGRDQYTERMMESLHTNVVFPFPAYKILMVDNPDQDRDFTEGLKEKYSIDQVIYCYKERWGIFEAVQLAWRNIPEDCNYVWHQENDFLFNEPVNIEAFVRVLQNKLIHQVALLRQAWYDDEVKSGGIFQNNPKAYRRANIAGIPLVVHREYFTHNPCLYRKSVIKHFEGYTEYSIMKHLPSGGWCAFYGSLTDAPRVTHIGSEKVTA